jgi:hypothetical protein
VPRIDTPPQDRAKRIERFQREARSAAQVWHPHVCPIYDVGEQDGQPYVVMAYVEGQSLAERLAQRGRFDDVGEAVALVRQVLDALSAVHRHGIIHRDLKPSNILLDAGGRAVLTDFGLARPEAEAERLTSEGVAVGTPAYMAPEQAAGQSERVGPWTDLYSVGVVLFEMLTGRLPFEGAPLAVLGKILHDPPPPLSRLRPYLAPRLEALLLKALDKEPEGRFRCAGEFIDALANLSVADPTASLSRTSPPPGEMRGRQSLLDPAGVARFQQRLQGALLHLLPPVLFGLAGVCLLIYLFSRNMESLLAIVWLLGLGSATLLLSLMLQWWVHREMTTRNPAGETMLMRAAGEGNVSRVRNLLTRGAEVNDKDNGGRTALMKAVAGGHAAVVRLLLAGGAEVTEKDNEGQTALMQAVAGGHTDIVGLLAGTRAKV